MDPGEDEGDVADPTRARSRADLFSLLAHTLAQDRSGRPLALRLCGAFVQILGADGGAITVAYNDPQRTTVCVTDATADRLEDLQDVLGEGPGPEACASGEHVRAHLGNGGGGRWPMLDQAVSEQLGELVVDAFPMRTQTTVLGVITVHSRGPARRSPSGRAVYTLADTVGAAILHQSADADDAVARWSARDRVHQATGMVVAQLAIAPDDAIALMRAFAFSHGLGMDEVAEEILERRQDFSSNADFRGDETP
ncbi:ANTAR domain-containing protein [Nocardioides pacificus]